MSVRLLILLINAFILSSCGRTNDYKEYIPIFVVGDNLVPIPDSLNESHKKNIQYVFKYYKVDFKSENNKVYYKGNINEELMWNYTLKANDTSWLNSH